MGYPLPPEAKSACAELPLPYCELVRFQFCGREKQGTEKTDSPDV